MEVVRIINAAGFDYVQKWIMDDPDYERGHLLSVLKGGLSNPQKNLFVVVIEGEDILAYVYAVLPDNVNYCWITQAWVDPILNNNEVVDGLFIKLLAWSDALGRKEIRFETGRCPDGFIKKWGFTPFATTMTLTIPENFMFYVLKGGRVKLCEVVKENGIKLKARDNVQPDSATAGSLLRADGSHTVWDSKSSDSVQRAIDSRIDSGNATSKGPSVGLSAGRVQGVGSSGGESPPVDGTKLPSESGDDKQVVPGPGDESSDANISTGHSSSDTECIQPDGKPVGVEGRNGTDKSVIKHDDGGNGSTSSGQPSESKP